MNAPLPRAATQADFAALLVALAIDHARAYGRPGARRQTTHAPVDGLAARPCTAEEYAVQQPSGMAVAGVPVSSLQPAGACDVALAGDGREAVNELLVVSASEPSTDIVGALVTTTETAAREYGENGYVDAIVADGVTFAVYGDYAETAWEVIQSFVMGRRE